FGAPPQPGQDLPAQAMPGHVVGVVLHHRGDHVVAVPDLGEQRVHDRVDGLGGVAVHRDAGPPGRADELGDRVVGRLEQRGHLARGAGLAAVHVLVPGGQGLVQVEQLAWWLGAGRVVGGDPAEPGEREVPPDGRAVERAGGHHWATGWAGRSAEPASSSLSWSLRTFPVEVSGKLPSSSHRAGTLNGASWRRQNSARSASDGGATSGTGRIAAPTTSPQNRSATPTTAASATAGCVSSTASISRG